MATVGLVDLSFITDNAETLMMLNRLDVALSPQGMSRFMGTAPVQYLQERTKNRFDSEGDSASGKWRPLAASTVEFRENAGYPGSHPINVRTGLLERYITQGSGTVVQSAEAVTLHFPDATGPGGLTEKKLRRAQLGDTKTPKRKVLAIDQTDLMHLTTQLAEYIFSAGSLGRA